MLMATAALVAAFMLAAAGALVVAISLASR